MILSKETNVYYNGHSSNLLFVVIIHYSLFTLH